MIKKTLKQYVDIVKTINAFSSNYILITILIKVLTLCNVYISLYINKLVLNKLTDVIFFQNQTLSSIIVLLVIGSAVEVLSTFLFNVLQYNLGKLKLRYDDDIAIKLAKTVSNLDMSYYDDPMEYNRTRQAGRCKSAILDNYNCILNLCFEIIAFVVALVVAVQFSVIVTILAIVSAIPGMIIRRKLQEKQYEIEKQTLSKQRFTDYLLSLFYNKNVEMEMQLYGFADSIVDKVTENQQSLREVKLSNSLEKAKTEGVVLIINRLLHILQQITLVSTIIKRKLSIGDFSYYSGIIKNLSSAVNNIVSSFNKMHMNNIKYDEYCQITSRAPKIETRGQIKIKLEQVSTIKFDNVCFRYPNTNNNVFNNISFSINIGEKIALVGPNGAGKTTLIKLLLRYYDPTSGRILVNGIDIKNYELSSYRKIFSAMFQDSNLYLMTIKDNISISDVYVDKTLVTERVNMLLADLDLEKINGEYVDIEKHYGREFYKDGYVLSKGQQQRLQAARTLFHNGALYILDEPVASMDAVAESQFLRTLVMHTSEKSVIYITHRYNNLDIMNNILVLDKGRIVERGTHSELLDLKGIYFKMFELQKNEKGRDSK